VLGDDDVFRLRRDGDVDRARSALGLRGGLAGGEEEIALADFGKIGAKADLHVDRAHSGDTGALQDAGGAGEQFLILDLDGDHAGPSILRKAVRAGSNDSWAGIGKKSRKVFTLIFVTFYCDRVLDITNRRMITPATDFRPMDFQRAGSVLLDRQRRERELLRMPLSGYASVYHVNTCVQLGGEKCSRLARGARG
jgi:hypothetical protein